jgi:monoamine oxidase
MGRSTLATRIREISATVAEAMARKVPVEQVWQERIERALTRRQFLQAAAAVGGAAAAIPALRNIRPAAANAATAPRIVVVGAGLAGLTCAYRLKQAGYQATVYEASSRMGGRCWSIRNHFSDGQVAEHGGELIDSNHLAIKHLAQELGLRLDNGDRAVKNGATDLYYFDGQPYTHRQASDDIKEMWQKIHRDVSQASYPTLYHTATERGHQLDQMSIVDWINESVPGGMESRLGRLLATAYTCYYGGEAAEQSSLNLLYMMGYRGQGTLRMYGPSDERYHVHGGNDQIPARLAEALAGQIEPNSALVAIRRSGDGSYVLTFDTAGTSREVAADKVVLALPFTVLRSHVDFSRAGFRPLKGTAIREMGMGSNVKLQLQFATRHWEGLGQSGETFADTGYQQTWEATRGQRGASGILVNYTGGQVGLSFSRGDADSRAREFLAQLEPVMPGISAQWNGTATLNYWPGERWQRGSYSFWKVGQYTRFAGVEGEREGDCHFAGEHTSIDFQGFLNGAVESGERAAGEILADFKAQKRR